MKQYVISYIFYRLFYNLYLAQRLLKLDLGIVRCFISSVISL